MYSLAKDGVTQSILQVFMTCRRQCQLMLEGWEVPLAKEALFFGSLFHTILEHHYKYDDVDIDKMDIDKSTLSPEVYEKCMSMSEALYVPYVNFWKKADSKKQWIELEPVFGITFDKYRLRGRIDGVCRIKGKLWLLENKTKSQIDEVGLMDSLMLDFQNLFYIIAAEEMFQEKVQGVLYNIIRKPQLRIRKKEDVQAYRLRMIDDIKSRPEFYFKRYEVVYTRKIIDEFKKDLKDILFAFEFWAGRCFEDSPKNRSACTRRFYCPYLQACSQGNMAGYTQTRKLFSELD